MKKIAIWKVILLSIVTLGIYSVVWLARRRNEFVRNYNQHLPHWLWLILPAFIGVIGWFASLILIFSTISDPGTQYDRIMLSTYSFLIIIPFGISLWWIDHFGQAVQAITNGRVPVLWTMLIYFFLGPIVIAVHQYYFNQIQPKKAATSSGPSQRFTTLAAIVVIISATMSVISWMSFPSDYQQSRDEYIHSVTKK